MAHSNQGSVVCQVESLQRQFARAPGLPFADLLPAELINQLLEEQHIEFHDRVYPPLVTLDRRFTLAEMRANTLAAVAPLGKSYVDLLAASTAKRRSGDRHLQSSSVGRS